MNDPEHKPGILGSIIMRGGWAALLILSLISIPLGLAAGLYVYWPFGIALLLGVHITDGIALLLYLLPFALAGAALFFFPRQGRAFFDALGKLYGLGLASFNFFFLLVALPATIIGFPLMFAANYFLGTTLPYWAFFPLGLLAIGLYVTIGNRLKRRD